MKKLLLLSATLISFASFGQSAEEKAWMDFMAPGEQHRLLAGDDGKWKEEITLYMAPGVPPITSTSVCVNEMILGGRYQKSTHTGTMMDTPFEGTGITGYDNGRKIWFSTWIDNMGTGMMYAEGNFDPVKKMFEFKGSTTDPGTGTIMKYRQTLKLIDKDHQEMEMFNMKDGKEFRSMVIKFTRA